MEERKEIIDSIRDNIAAHMKSSLAALRDSHRDGILTDSFRAYVVMFKDGTERVITPETMIEVALAEGDKILLTMHFWIYQEQEYFFSCCEIASIRGIQASWIAKVNSEPDEHDGWVTPQDAGGAIEEYFTERTAMIGQAVASGRAKAAAKDNNIDFDPGRWVSNDKASDHGAN